MRCSDQGRQPGSGRRVRPVVGTPRRAASSSSAIPVLAARSGSCRSADVITPDQFEPGFLAEHRAARPRCATLSPSTVPAPWARRRSSSPASCARPPRAGRSRCWPSTAMAPGSSRRPHLPLKANGSGDVTRGPVHRPPARDGGRRRRPRVEPSSSVFDLLAAHPRTPARRELQLRAEPGRDRRAADAVRGPADPLTGRPGGPRRSGPGMRRAVGRTAQSTTRSSRWTTSRSYAGPSSRASSRVERPSSCGISAGVEVDQPAGDRPGPSVSHSSTGSPARELALDRGDPGRQQRRAPLTDRRAPRRRRGSAARAAWRRARATAAGRPSGVPVRWRSTVPTSPPASAVAARPAPGQHDAGCRPRRRSRPPRPW